MPLDTLAFAKHLESEGIDRRVAEAHAVAITRHRLCDVATKADVAALRRSIEISSASSDARTRPHAKIAFDEATLWLAVSAASLYSLPFMAIRFAGP